MNPAHAGDAPYRVPHETSRWRAIALAAAMHAGLFLCLWISVQWQNSEPVAVEAEVWDMKTQAAAPPPDPTTAPEPTPPTPAVVAPPPPVAAQPVEAPQVETPPPDIALERKKAKLKAEQQELAEKQRQQQIAQEEQDKADRLAQAKADAKAKAQADAKAKALADAKAAKQQEELDKALDAKMLAAAEKAEKTRLANAQKAAEKQRAQNLQRLQDSLAGSGGSGEAAKSTGARSDSGYVAAITAKIKSNIAYNADSDAGNPRAVYRIDQLPTGEIIGVHKIKSSGIPAYDSAVENAIAKSSPLPKKKDGTVERQVEAGFNLKDLP